MPMPSHDDVRRIRAAPSSPMPPSGVPSCNTAAATAAADCRRRKRLRSLNDAGRTSTTLANRENGPSCAEDGHDGNGGPDASVRQPCHRKTSHQRCRREGSGRRWCGHLRFGGTATMALIAVAIMTLLSGRSLAQDPSPPAPGGTSNNSNSNNNDSSSNNNINDNDNGGIGDMHRSDSSTSRFFRSIDRDGDGILEKPEMESFVRDAIGGSAFDTSDEVKAGVDQVLERLDRDQDDGLDQGDVLAYWLQLESLLTAEEVAEWVVHAVQLPEAVGDIFLDHHVTGYDFPELVDHAGDAIEKELGIEKASYRKKILRHINARMLGIGTVPTPPSSFKHTLESCSTVSLSWSKSIAKGFPVHSYRLQRRAVPVHGSSLTTTSTAVTSATTPSSAATGTTGTASGTSGSESQAVGAGSNGGDVDSSHGGPQAGAVPLVCDAAVDASRAAFPKCGGVDGVTISNEYAVVCSGAGVESRIPSTMNKHKPTSAVQNPAANTVAIPPTQISTPQKSSSWVTIYRGGDTDYIDTDIEEGYSYLYRVQAWNSVGRSEWNMLDIGKSLKKYRCTADSKASGSKSFDGVLRRASFHDDGDGWTVFGAIYALFDFIVLFMRAVFAVAALVTAYMRIKRANALSSTSANLDPVFPWFFRGINKISLKILGVEIVPKSMLGGKGRKRFSSSIYDKEVGAVGLNGYKRSPLADSPSPEQSKRPNARARFAQRRSVSASAIMSTLNQIDEGELLGSDQRRQKQDELPRSSSIGGMRNSSRGNSVGNNNAGSKKKGPVKKTFFGRAKSGGTEETSDLSEVDDMRVTTRSLPAHITTSRRSLMTDMSAIDEEDENSRATRDMSRRSPSGRSFLEDGDDDYNRCNTCHKRYKFPHRFRHHCGRCLSTFCHKHGKTSHSNLVACKVPSECICDVCINSDDYSRNQSSRSNRSSTGSRR